MVQSSRPVLELEVQFEQGTRLSVAAERCCGAHGGASLHDEHSGAADSIVFEREQSFVSVV